MKKTTLRYRWAVCLALGMTACASCSKTEPDAPEPGDPKPVSAAFPAKPKFDVPGRVFLIGIDGANWAVFDQVIAADVMPNLKRLRDTGARGNLRSMDPTASAIVWTTIATGKHPDKHGIRGFVAETTDGRLLPVNSTMRRTKALWNIVSEAGIKVAFLSWWVTWPAERVNGVLCSDYTWPLKKSGAGFAIGVDDGMDRDYRTWPPELIRQLEPMIKTESRLSPVELETLHLRALPEMGGYAVREIILKDVSVAAMSSYLLDQHDPGLFAVYFDGFDAYCHQYWPYFKKYAAAVNTGPQAADRLNPQVRDVGQAMYSHLQRIDAALGDVMARAAPNDVVMVVSDHGYGDNPGSARVQRTFDDWITPEHWHTLDGILVAAGGPICEGAVVADAGVMDIAPTVLSLLGMPVAEDLDGKVLTGMLSERFLADHPPSTIETYETGGRTGGPIESPFDKQMLERLRSLGYLE